MLILFVFLSLLLSAVRGLKTCRGPFELPELEEINVTPVYRNGIQSVIVTLDVLSKTPTRAYWWDLSTFVTATEENEEFKSSIKVSGDRHVFKLRATIPSDVRNITKFVSRIDVELAVTYGCNYLQIIQKLPKLIEIVNSRVKLPIITELPHQRYFIEDEGWYSVRIGFTNGDRTAPDVNTYCRSSFERNDGKMLTNYNDGPLNASTIDSGGGSTEVHVTCQLDFNKNQESRLVTIRAVVQIKTVKGNDGYNHNYSIDLQITSELRKPGIDMPSLRVCTVFGEDLIKSTRTAGNFVLPTVENVTSFLCLADAESKPHLVAAQRDKKGNVHLIKEDQPNSDYMTASTSLSTFTVKSPPTPMDEDEYICSAGTRSNVVSRRFYVKRVVDVNIKWNSSTPILMQEGQNKRYDLRCEATGAPTPEIRFYESPTWPLVVSRPSVYQSLNKGKEIHDSDLFQTVTWNQGGIAYGKLVVKNFDKLIENLQDHFWKQNVLYRLECYAFNDFSDAYRRLAYSRARKANMDEVVE